MAPTDPIPASNAPYLWRVRRADSAGNLGPWSATGSFISSGTAPNLLGPKASAKVRGMTASFEWTEVPAAARYVLNLNGSSDSKVSTVATAYAVPSPSATGAYNWSVTALDAAGNALGTSATRTVKIDSTSPIVKKVKPAPIKPTSTISIKFSERVKGISKKSVVLVKVLPTGKFKKLKAKISLDKKKTTAKVNPKGRLRPGTPYQVLLNTKKIRDKVGNPLAPIVVAPTFRLAFRVQADQIGRTPAAGLDHRVPGTFDTAP